MATKKNTTAKTENRNSRNNSSAVTNNSSKAKTGKTAKATKATKQAKTEQAVQAEPAQPAQQAQQAAAINAYMLNRHIYNDGKIRCFKTQHGDYYKVFVYCENFDGWDKYQFSQLFKDANKALKYAFVLKQKTGEAINYDSFCMLMAAKTEQAEVNSEEKTYHF